MFRRKAKCGGVGYVYKHRRRCNEKYQATTLKEESRYKYGILYII